MNRQNENEVDFWFKRSWRHHWMPVVLGLVVTLAVLGLWQELRVNEQLHVERLVQHEANAVALELNRELSTRLLALQRIANRWQTSGGTPKPLWEADAANIIEDYYGYQAIEWVDATSTVRWIVPLAGNEAARNLDLNQEPRRRVTLDIARDLRQLMLTRTISLAQGGKGFLACVPLFVADQAAGTGGDRFDGFILAVFRFQDLFDGILRLPPQYGVQIYDHSGLIYSQGEVSNPSLSKTMIVRSYGADWQVRVFPTAALLSEAQSLLPEVVLWGGIAAAWALAFMVDLGQRASYYAQRAKRVNRQLHQEIDQHKTSEAALRQSESTLRSFFNSETMLMGIVELHDNDILHLSDNQTTAAFFGTTPEAMHHRFASDMGVPPTYMQQWIRAYREAERTQAPVRFEYLHQTATDQHWLAASVCQIAGNSSSHPRFSYIVEDITERKRVERERREMADVLEHAVSGISRLDAEGRYLYVNQAYADTTGYHPDEMLGLFWQQTVHPDALEPLTLAYQHMRQNGTVEVDAQGLRKDGSSFYKQLVMISMYDDQHQFIGHYCFMKDISERVRLETERKAAEAALATSQQRYQNLVENSPDIIERFDRHLRHLYVSPSLTQLAGLPATAFIGKTCRELGMDAAMVNAWETAAENLLATGQKQVIEFSCPTLQGVRSFEMAIAPEWSEQQTIESILCISRDITDRKQVEADLRHHTEMLQAIVNHIPVMIAVFTAEGEIEFINPELQKVLGWSLEDWQQHDVLLDCYPDPTERQIVMDHILAATGQWQDFTTRTATGQALETTWANVPFSDGLFLGIGQDISDRKRKEQALQQAMQVAEAANLAKSTFLANMSHELRTPLNVILGFAQVMTHDPALTPHQREDLQTIRRSGDYLLSLINDVLDLSKIEAGHYTLDEHGFDLISLLHTLRTMMAERARAKSLQLIFDIAPEVPQFVVADEQKLRQVLLNLLSNAIKFTQHGSVTLQATVPELTPSATPPSSHDPVTLHLDVIDTGCGMTMEEQGYIFDAFVQAEAGKKAVSGTGLGLAISRKLLDLMGGTIAVHSLPHRGSHFTLAIPVCPTSGVHVPLHPRSDRLVVGVVPHQTHHRILVVDDQPENRTLLVRLLTQLGLEVQEAANGYEAIRIWKEWQPNLTWMDIRMPGLDGYETTRQIRSLEQTRASVIIALTAQASQSDRTLALAAGCNDYISKPFREETLLLKLREHLHLDYLYADPEHLAHPPHLAQDDDSETGGDRLNATQLSALPQEWVHSLEAATVRGDDRAIVDLVNQLPHPLNAVGTVLAELADNYQFEQILQLLQRYNPT